MQKCVYFFVFLVVLATAAGENSDGYISDPDNPKNTYKLVYQAETWVTAREVCKEDGAQLAVPKTEAEFTFLQKLVRGMQYPSIKGTDFKLVVWLGVNNMNNHEVWVDLDGNNINETGFNKWSGNNGMSISNDPKEPHCAVIDAVNPGLRDWWCHKRQPFFCQKIDN